MMVLVVVLLAYLAFFLFTCRAPYSGDEWGPQWLSCGGMVKVPSRQRHSSLPRPPWADAPGSWRRTQRSASAARTPVPKAMSLPLTIGPSRCGLEKAMRIMLKPFGLSSKVVFDDPDGLPTAPLQRLGCCSPHGAFPVMTMSFGMFGSRC